MSVLEVMVTLRSQPERAGDGAGEGITMTEMLALPLARTRAAWYAVPAGVSAPAARKIAMTGVAEHASGARKRLIEELTVTFGVLRTASLTPAQREVVQFYDGSWVSVRAKTGEPGTLPHELAARTMAAELAWRLGFPVADMLVPDLLTSSRALASLHPKDDGAFRVSDWVRVAYLLAPCGGVDLETTGMVRYGLPELRIAAVPARLTRSWCAVLTGVAFRVIEQFQAQWKPGDVVAVITEETGVTADDIAAAYCLPGGYRSREMGWRWTSLGNPETLVGLSLLDGMLTVGPPSSWDGSRTEFCAAACASDLRAVLPAVAPFVEELQETYRGTREDRLTLHDLVRGVQVGPPRLGHLPL
jgi:hypothetical protein